MSEPIDEQRRALNLKRFWDDADVKALLAGVRDDIANDWEQAKTKEKREECHAEMRSLTRLIRKFNAQCEYADRPDTRKLRT